MASDPYRPPSAELNERAEAPALANRGRRLAAALIDLAFLGTPSWVGLALTLVAMRATEDAVTAKETASFIGTAMQVTVLGIVGTLIVVAGNLILVRMASQSIGKHLLRIRVVRSDGSPVSFWCYVGLRVVPVALSAHIPWVGPLIFVADAVGIFRLNQKCFHDEIADTIVVMAR